MNSSLHAHHRPLLVFSARAPRYLADGLGGLVDRPTVEAPFTPPFALVWRRDIHHAYRNQAPFPIVERLLDPEPNILGRLRSPARALRGAAFLGVTEPEHEVDSVACGSGIPRVLGDQLTSDRCPNVTVAASLDLGA